MLEECCDAAAAAAADDDDDDDACCFYLERTYARRNRGSVLFALPEKVCPWQEPLAGRSFRLCGTVEAPSCSQFSKGITSGRPPSV